jgi:integrase
MAISRGKTGRRRIILQSDAVTFFSRVATDRDAKQTLLKRSDGGRWNRSHQQRRMAATLATSGLNKSGTFYALRHSYISRAIEGGVPLNIIAENCCTSVRMIENTYAKILAEKRRDFIERGPRNPWAASSRNARATSSESAHRNVESRLADQ